MHAGSVRMSKKGVKGRDGEGRGVIYTFFKIFLSFLSLFFLKFFIFIYISIYMKLLLLEAVLGTVIR